MGWGDENWIDPDIRALDIDYVEKSGLQVFRNYTRSFEKHGIELLRNKLAAESLDLSDLKRVLDLIVEEDMRLAVVVVCGYGDELLRTGFEALVPQDIPGGPKEMLSGFGPISDFSKRIRLAFMFEIVSRDLLQDLDRLRKVRNRISHDWDIATVSDLLSHPHMSQIHRIEDLLQEAGDMLGADGEDVAEEIKVRARLIWLAGRLTYEVAAFPRARSARLEPSKALYADGGTTWLRAVAQACMAATKRLS